MKVAEEIKTAESVETDPKRKRVALDDRTLQNKKQKTDQLRPWSDLPEDLLWEITKKFFLHDLVRLMPVCKNWHARIAGFEPGGTQVPWILQFDWVKENKKTELKFGAMLYDPNSRNHFPLKFVNWWKSGKILSLLNGANPCASRHGWLLFVKSIRKSGTISFIFYNPFLCKLRILPLLKSIDTDCHCFLAAFSKDPCSTGCVVFVPCQMGLRCDMATFTIGEKKWRTSQIGTPGGWEPVWELVTSMVYSDEKDELYCLFSRGTVAKLEVVRQRWSVMLKEEPVQPRTLMECKGHLLSATRKEDSVDLNRIVHIYQFDWSRMDWVAIDSFGRGAISREFYLTSFAVEEASFLRNIIYNFSSGDKNAGILQRISCLSFKAQQLYNTNLYSMSYQPMRTGRGIAWVQSPQPKLGY